MQVTEPRLTMQPDNLFENTIKIKVLGVGGAGSNAVNRMIDLGVAGVEYYAFNTDTQSLGMCKAKNRIQLGEASARGLGSGGDPSRGETAAKESEKVIAEILNNTDMVFITAGMGGGTGTGAAPVVAEMAKRQGILTVGVVTKPFVFEGPKRIRQAEEGARKLMEHVDTLICVPNDRLVSFVENRMSVNEAFQVVDDVLRQGVQGISDLILKPGNINADFADVTSILRNAGTALMGIGRGVGEHRARMAAQNAAKSKLLETSLDGATRVLVNFTASDDFAIGEAYEAMEYINQFTDVDDADITIGHVLKEGMNGEIEITLLAAGMTGNSRSKSNPNPDVFTNKPGQNLPKAVVEGGQAPEPDKTGTQISAEEIDLDIPSFLRRFSR